MEEKNYKYTPYECLELIKESMRSIEKAEIGDRILILLVSLHERIQHLEEEINP